jgi:hypothetical protein
LNPRSWHALERSGLRRGASGGRVLGEEERAAENIYIKVCLFFKIFPCCYNFLFSSIASGRYEESSNNAFFCFRLKTGFSVELQTPK